VKYSDHQFSQVDCGTAGKSWLDSFTVEADSADEVRHFALTNIQRIAPAEVVPSVCRVSVNHVDGRTFNVVVDRLFD